MGDLLSNINELLIYKEKNYLSNSMVFTDKNGIELPKEDQSEKNTNRSYENVHNYFYNIGCCTIS